MKVSSNLHILFLFFVAAMFSVSLWSLFGFHLYLLFSNKSTLGECLMNLQPPFCLIFAINTMQSLSLIFPLICKYLGLVPTEAKYVRRRLHLIQLVHL